ncbi:MAG TPA: hypothetical protein DDX98_12900 [Bacteroidales bacterium]|nr:hypothetical protein [Bacteroidales bacterium]
MKKTLLALLVVFVAGFYSQTNGQGMVDVRIIPAGDEGETYFYLEDDDDVVYDSVLVSLSSDDAEQENDAIDALYDDDLDAGWEGQEGDASILTMGMRFQNLTIPPGATIDSAFIIVCSHEAKLSDDIANLTVYGDASDNAPTFTEDSLITDRAQTSATVAWTVAEDWKIWGFYRTPDLKTIVQEIVNRGGWASGNAIAFIIAGENQGPSDVENAREWEAYENISDPGDEDEAGNPGDGQNHPERVPQLIVYYDGYTAPSSVEAATNSDNLRIYPNVVTEGEIRLVFGNSAFNNVNIYNTLGQQVKSFFGSYENNARFSVSDLPSGMYFLSIDANNSKVVKQFIVK